MMKIIWRFKLNHHTVQTRVCELIEDLKELLEDDIVLGEEGLKHDLLVLQALIPKNAEMFIRNRKVNYARRFNG